MQHGLASGVALELPVPINRVAQQSASHQFIERQGLLALARDDDAGERNDRAIDIAILRLRRVIETDPKQPRWIQTVWGIGYRFSP